MDPNSAASITVPDSVPTALTIAVVALAAVVVFLFRLYTGRNASAEAALSDKDKMIADERQKWAVEREKLNADIELERQQITAAAEKRHREAAESYAAELAEMNDKYLAREDAIRKDFGDRIERIASEASKSAQAQNEVLNKIYERFVGPRRGRTNG